MVFWTLKSVVYSVNLTCELSYLIGAEVGVRSFVKLLGLPKSDLTV